MCITFDNVDKNPIEFDEVSKREETKMTTSSKVSFSSFSIRPDLLTWLLSLFFFFLEVYKTELLVHLTPSKLDPPAGFLTPATSVSILPGSHTQGLESALFLLFYSLHQIP